MKKLCVLFYVLFINVSESYCQLLSNPPLTVKDIEIALSNPDHLRGILLEHNYKYLKLDNADCKRSESWESPELTKNASISTSIISFVIYEWKPNYGPRQGAIVSIDVQIVEDISVMDKLKVFTESVRSNFTERNIRNRNDSYPFLVYTKKGYKMEVEVGQISKNFIRHSFNFNIYK
jgi:hypothetical protein